jgi:drug/metabolite transporter (DMT)-like permease
MTQHHASLLANRREAVHRTDADQLANESVPRWRERTTSLAGSLTLAGITLLGASELADRLEPNLGFNVINLYIAFSIAAFLVCVGALVGDTILAAVERRSGRRPGAQHVTLLLAVPGAAAIADILAQHLRHPPALDGWLGLAGGILLLIAAGLHHLTSRQPSRARLSR